MELFNWKHKLIAVYLAISLVFGLWNAFFGNYRYQSIAYNLGVGFTWPIDMFRWDTEIDGDTAATFTKSLNQAIEEHKNYNGKIMFVSAVGKIAMFYAAEATPSITLADYETALNGGELPQSFLVNVLANEDVAEKVRDELDGMEFGAVIAAGEDFEEDLIELLSERKPVAEKAEEPGSNSKSLANLIDALDGTGQFAEEKMPTASSSEADGDSCVTAKIDAFHTEMGEDAMIMHDMLNEWEGECGVPLS